MTSFSCIPRTDTFVDSEIRGLLFQYLNANILNFDNKITTIDFILYRNGKVSDEEHRLNGHFHRKLKPAYRAWGYDGKIVAEEFWKNGKLQKRNF